MSGGRSLSSDQLRPCNEAEEREMHEAFLVQARELLNDPTRFDKPAGTLRVGIESEVAILATSATPADEALRNRVISSCPSQVGATVELGASQIEFHTPPIDVVGTSGWKELASIYETNFVLLRAAARLHNAHILRCGTNPFVPIAGTPRTSLPKYKLVPDFYNAHRNPTIDTRVGREGALLDVSDAAVVSAFQGFQINLETRSLAHAVEMMNRMICLGPYFSAPAGNARFLQSTDSGMSDARLLAWEKSHDRTGCTFDTQLADLRLLTWERCFSPRNALAELGLRVGLPPAYFNSAQSYLERSGRFPFIQHSPKAALPIAIGMTWLDARLKFIGDSAVVEWRLPSTQPRVDDELQLMLLVLGALTDAEAEQRPLLPISYVAENRRSAMELGGAGEMWFVDDEHVLHKLPYRDGIEWEIMRAKHGLSRLGLAQHLDEQRFRSWINVGGSHSGRLALMLDPASDHHYSAEALAQALAELGMIVS